MTSAEGSPWKKKLTPKKMRLPKARRDRSSTSRSRVYTDVICNKPKEYWDYENFNVTWG